MLIEFHRLDSSKEQVAYLDGVPMQGGGVVTTLTLPNAVLEPRRYRISADAMSEVGKHLRAHNLRRLAQVHTHGGRGVDHSSEDDRRAYSQQDGAVSIVLPYHARCHPTIIDAGVHVREPHGWRRLEAHEVHRYVWVVPCFLDFRRT
jgi:hypothetical protein